MKAVEKLGQLLVRKGLLTQEQFDSCLREQQGGPPDGKPSSLSEIIVSRGYTRPGTLSESLRSLGPLHVLCPKCSKRYSIKSPRLESVAACPHCGGPLEIEEEAALVEVPAAPKPGVPPPEVAEAAKDPRRKLGRYVLLDELGRGGYAVVYKAWDGLLQHFVAIKIIRTQDIGLENAARTREVEEFLREARTAIKLSHPNIVRVYELGSHEDRHFLSMELIEGSTLAQMLRPQRAAGRGLPFYADPSSSLRILRDVALALDYAHTQSPPVVHRDVKPQNILVDRAGRACIVDFGLAKEMRPEGGATLTLTGHTKGTPCYMSPEQATAGGGGVDARTDVYALGAILYECLTGQPPFTGPTTREILNRVVSEEPARPSAVLKARGLPHQALPDLENICLRALEKAKDRRYPSARSFAAELERFLSGKDVRARGVSAPLRVIRWAGRHRAVAILSMAVLLLSVIAVAALLKAGGSPERVVERVVVTDEAEARYREAIKEIDGLASDMRFDRAAAACDRFLAKAGDGSQKDALRHRRDELRMQADLLKGVATRIAREGRSYEQLRLRSGKTMDSVQLIGATSDTLFLRHQDRTTDLAWGGLGARQFVTIAKDSWPDMDGRTALALGVWCMRHDLTDEAAQLFSKPGAVADDADARRYREELAAKTKSVDASLDEQIARLLAQAEKALADRDFAVARARFERVLVLRAGDPEAVKGLERADRLSKPAAATSEPEKKPEPAPAVDAAVLLARAQEKARRGDFTAAVDDCTELIRLKPDEVEAYLLRAFIRHFRMEYPPAIADFTAVIRIKPAEPRAFAWRGLAYYDTGEWARAVADFRSASKLEPSNFWMKLDVWLARSHLGETDAATRELKEDLTAFDQMGEDADWLRLIGKYLTGEQPEPALQKAASTGGGSYSAIQRQCLAFFLIGTRRLSLNDKTGAAANFKACLDTQVTGLNVEQAAQAELDRLGVKAAAPPAAAAGSILALIPPSALLQRYAETREAFLSALGARDPAQAAKTLGAFLKRLVAETAGSAVLPGDEKGLAKIAAGSFGDPAVRELADAAIAWIAAQEDPEAVRRDVVFDLRDVSLVAISLAEFEEAFARLTQAGVVVPLQSGKKGGIRKTAKGLVLYEIMEAGGQKAEVGSPASLRGDSGERLSIRDIVTILRTDRARRNAEDFRTKLGTLVLIAGDAGKDFAASLSAVATEPAFAFSADEKKRLRWDEYLTGAAFRGIPAVELLSPSLQSGWKTDSAAEVGKTGLRLPAGGGAQLQSGFLMSRNVAELAFRTDEAPSKAVLEIELIDWVTQQSRLKIGIDTGGGRVSFVRGGGAPWTRTMTLAPGAAHTATLWVYGYEVALRVDGIMVERNWIPGQTKGATWTEGRLRLASRNGPLTVTSVRVRDGGDGSAFGLEGSLADTSRYRGRWRDRDALLSRGGGNASTEAAVTAALRWLVRHQNADGSWGAEEFRKRCAATACGGPGERDFDTGVTALSLLAFLGAGYTQLSREEFPEGPGPGGTVRVGEVVSRGLLWLMARQDPEGCIGERGMKYNYNHALATLCLMEATGMTGSKPLRLSAQKALDFIVASQNPGSGWRYSSKCGDNDTSVTGCMISALKAAEMADFRYPQTVAAGALRWLQEATEQTGYFQAGYNARSTGKVFVPGKNEQFDHHATMSAISAYSLVALTKKRMEQTAFLQVNLLTADLPEWRTNRTDFYYWYWSSVAIYQQDGPDGGYWRKWNEILKDALVHHQRGAGDGCRAGSWDPDNERWGGEGGRIYTTALGALTLETYYRIVPQVSASK